MKKPGKLYKANLDVIIAVGYRVNSKKATMFRNWTNRVLKEFIIKGYVMDEYLYMIVHLNYHFADYFIQ